MLGNNEQIQGVNLSEVFSQMVGELPWSSLKEYIQANTPLLKMCTIGGHRLVPEKRKRFASIVCREAEKAEFAEAVTNGVFAVWYPVHADLHQALEGYYKSDEYKAYREANKLGEEDYVLPDAKLDELFKVDDLKIWKVLLCFSPLKFTREQANRLLNDNSGNEELVDRLEALQASNEDLTRKNEQMTAEVTRLRAKTSEDASEIQDLKKQLRQARQDVEQSQRTLEVVQAESRHAAQQMSEADNQREEAEQALKNEMSKNVARIQNELERVNKELQGWQSRYEEQCTADHVLQDELNAAKKDNEDMKAELDQKLGKLKHVEKFADLVLSKIDWPHIGAAMKLSPTMRRNFNSLVRRLDYEEDRTQTIEGTLPEFWATLNEAETKLVNAISVSNTEEVANGNVNQYWEGLKDQFLDVQTSLEARVVLLGMLQDIFYQTMDMDDLADSILGKTKSKKKSE